MSNEKNAMSEQLLDAAACDALGANTPGESAAYQQELAACGGAGEPARIDRDLRETVARLSAVSPHINPGADLRGRILQQTAPTTFRMEDYRKVTRENGRFYRWGFYAAMAFLMLGAYYNLSLRGSLQSANRQMQAANAQVQERNVALAAFVNPNSDEIKFVNQGKLIGKAVVDRTTHSAVVFLPESMVPADKTIKLTLPENGEKVAYNTVLVRVPGDVIQAPAGQTVEAVLNVKSLQPASHGLQVAGQ